jgi:hypothetical protein
MGADSKGIEEPFFFPDKKDNFQYQGSEEQKDILFSSIYGHYPNSLCSDINIFFLKL